MKFKLYCQNSYSMGLFSPFIYKNKKGKKFWLHMKQRGKGVLYYFSDNPEGAINSLPKGFMVFENPKTGLPMIKKGQSGILATILGGLGRKKEEKKEGEEATEKPKEEAPEAPKEEAKSEE